MVAIRSTWRSSAPSVGSCFDLVTTRYCSLAARCTNSRSCSIRFRVTSDLLNSAKLSYCRVHVGKPSSVYRAVKLFVIDQSSHLDFPFRNKVRTFDCDFSKPVPTFPGSRSLISTVILSSIPGTIACQVPATTKYLAFKSCPMVFSS
jgi:hypothetical protein